MKLVLFAKSGDPGTLNHIGVEVETTDDVAAVIARTQELGFDQHIQQNVSCCFAVQDKTWVKGPENDWEFYTVLADSARDVLRYRRHVLFARRLNVRERTGGQQHPNAREVYANGGIITGSRVLDRPS